MITNGSDDELDVPCPATTLTRREKAAVMKTWSEVCSIGKVNVGIALFDLFFARNPQYVQLFRHLRDVPRDQLSAHARYKAHGATVVQAVNAVIETLDDADTAVVILQKTGRDHVKRKLRPEHFEELQRTLMMLLEKTLTPDKWTPFVRDTWDKTLTVVMSVVIQAMKDEELAQQQQQTIH